VKPTPTSISNAFPCLLGIHLLFFGSSCGDQPATEDGASSSSVTLSESGEGEPIDDDRPNLILVSIDAFRTDRSSAYGYEQATTPALEKLASESLVFERAFTPMPLALPAHASMLTGLLPPEHGVRDDIECSLAFRHRTIATALASNGYRTGAFVGSLNLHVKYGLGRGFDRYDDAIKRRKKFGNDVSARDGEEVVERAIEWLNESTGRASFLFVNLSEPDAKHALVSGDSAEFEDAYNARLSAADSALGSLIAGLEESGLYDDSYILVTSGSGEGLGDHGELGHGYLLSNSTLRVPLVLKKPGSSESKRVSTPASLVDIPATFFAAAGVDPLETVGLDLVALAADPQPERAIYSESLVPTRFQRAPHFSLISGDWKYIQSSTSTLFDLASNPGETENLIESESARAKELSEELTRLRGPRALTSPAPLDFIDEYEVFESFRTLLARRQYDEVLAACDQIEAEHEGLCATDYYRMLVEIAGYTTDRTESKIDRLKAFLDNYPIRKRPVAGKLEPFPSTVAFDLGMELVKADRGSEAIYPLRDALKARPHEVTGHMAVGESFLQINRKKAGIKSLETAANIEATADLSNTLGILHSQEGNTEKSHAHLLRAIELDPKKSLYQANLARSYAKRFEWAEAFAAFEHSLELDPMQAELELEYGYHLATVNDDSLRDVNAAMEAVRRALENDLPVTAVTLEGVAAIYAEGEAYDLAIQFAERAMDLATAEGEMQLAAKIFEALETYQFEVEQTAKQ